MTKTKEQIITKIVRDLPNSNVLSEMNGSEWYGWFEECWNEAINYTRCCTELKSKECPMCNEEKDCEGHNVCEDCGGRSF